MKNFIKNIILNLLNALNTKKEGFSARKLTAFISVLCIIYIHIRFVEPSNILSVLLYDMAFVLVLLGIVTIDQLYRFKTGATTNTPETTSKPSDPIVSGDTSNNIISNQQQV